MCCLALEIVMRETLFWCASGRNRWLVDNNSDMCDSVRGTTLGLPFQVDYDELKQQALAGEVDWVPPAFTYKDGELWLLH